MNAGAARADSGALARLFTHFADHEVGDDPLYAALCRLVAERPHVQAMLLHAPATQRLPNLLLAAVHERVLAGVSPALAEYFPSAGGTRMPDAALPTVFEAFVAAQHDALCQLIATRHTQTNEIGRCAVLWPALCALRRRTGRTRIALLDFGCSAGLNLGVDGYRYDYGGFALGAEATAGTPTIECHLVGDGGGSLRALAPLAPVVAERIGIDPLAADVHDDAQVRWLRACLWPHDGVRLARFDRAVARARQRRWRVQRCDDCAAAVEPWLDGLDADLQPVVFNSWVLHYLDAGARQRHIEFMHELVRRRGVAWLSAEGAHVALATAPPAGGGDAVVGDAELAKGTLWWLTWRAAPGAAPAAALLARSHAHGRWLQWLDAAG